MRRFLLWFWLAGKRLLKKPLFLILLVLMPVMTALYIGSVAHSDGVVSVALAVEAGADDLTVQTVKKLAANNDLISFSFQSKEKARRLVETGEADAAWIFPKDLGDQMARFLADGNAPQVQVLQRQDTVLLRLSREILGGALFDCCAEPMYLRYLREHVPELAQLSDGQLVAYMSWFRGNERLFDFVQTDGSQVEATAYLISPLRGIFGVMILLCAMAAGMYFYQDLRSGMFQRVPESALGVVEFVSQLAALWGVTFAAVICVAVSGSWAGLGRELAAAALYLLCCAAFGCLLRRLCGKLSALAGLMPVLTVAALVVCPVFVDLPALRAVQYLLPPTYYIRAAYSDSALPLMAGYAFVCGMASVCLDALAKFRAGRKAVLR